MLINLMLLIGGFIMLIKGADFLIDGAVSLAKKFHVSEIAIGLTIVALGTSAPELIVNIISVIRDQPEICYGNIIGSNIFNTLVVLGVAGLIKPLLFLKATVQKEIPIVIFGIILLILLSNNFWTGGRMLSRLDGIILLVCLFFFLLYVFHLPHPELRAVFNKMTLFKTEAYLAGGIAGLLVGGELVVKNAVKLALHYNISKEFISLTIVAVGTSLPELITSMVALRRKSTDIAVGNVIGSNIFNLFGILGISAVIKPIIYNPDLNIDLLILSVITILLFLLIIVGRVYKLNRIEASILLLCYVGYIYFLIQRG